MLGHPDQAWAVGRLLQWGLRPLSRPAQEQEYQELVDRYLDDTAFRRAVQETADGLGVIVVDVSVHGIVLAPTAGSIFALSPAGYRPTSSKVEDRLLDGLVQLALAATVFPKARDLEDDPDMARPPVTVAEVEERLRSICDQLAERARGQPDPEASDEERGLMEAWRIYKRRLDVQETKDARRAARTTRRIISFALERLREYGCFIQERQQGDPAWRPTRRYQVMVQQIAATGLHDLVQEAMSVAEQEGG